MTYISLNIIYHLEKVLSVFRHLHRTTVAQREAGVRVREPLPYFRLLQQPPPAPKPWLPVSRDGLHEETGGMISVIGIMDIPDKDTFFH